MIDYKAALKEPWVRYTAGGVLLLGVGWIAIRSFSGGATGGVVVGQTDPAAATLAAQQATLQQQAASQASAQSFSLASDHQKAAEALAMATLNGQVSTAQQVNQITGTLNLAGLQLGGQEHIAELASHAQETLAAQAANAQIEIQRIGAGVSQHQIDATVAMASQATQASIINNAGWYDTQRALAATAAGTQALQLAATTTIATGAQAAQVQTSQIAAGVAAGAQAAQVQTSQIAAGTVVQTAQIAADSQLGIAHIDGDVATAVSHDQTAAQIAIAAANAAAAQSIAAGAAALASHVSDNTANVANHASNNNLVGSIANVVGHIIGAIF